MGDLIIEFCVNNYWKYVLPMRDMNNIDLFSISWANWWVSITILNFEFVLRTKRGYIKDE